MEDDTVYDLNKPPKVDPGLLFADSDIQLVDAEKQLVGFALNVADLSENTIIDLRLLSQGVLLINEAQVVTRQVQAMLHDISLRAKTRQEKQNVLDALDELNAKFAEKCHAFFSKAKSHKYNITSVRHLLERKCVPALYAAIRKRNANVDPAMTQLRNALDDTTVAPSAAKKMKTGSDLRIRL